MLLLKTALKPKYYYCALIFHFARVSTTNGRSLSTLKVKGLQHFLRIIGSQPFGLRPNIDSFTFVPLCYFAMPQNNCMLLHTNISFNDPIHFNRRGDFLGVLCS